MPNDEHDLKLPRQDELLPALRNKVILGSSEQALELLKELEKNPDLPVSVVDPEATKALVELHQTHMEWGLKAVRLRGNLEAEREKRDADRDARQAGYKQSVRDWWAKTALIFGAFGAGCYFVSANNEFIGGLMIGAALHSFAKEFVMKFWK